jgi:hypothetical protein
MSGGGHHMLCGRHGSSVKHSAQHTTSPSQVTPHKNTEIVEGPTDTEVAGSRKLLALHHNCQLFAHCR